MGPPGVGSCARVDKKYLTLYVRNTYNAAMICMEAPMAYRTRNPGGLANARAYADPGGGQWRERRRGRRTYGP